MCLQERSVPLHNETVGELSHQLVQKVDVLQTPDHIWAVKGPKFVDGCVLTKPSCFLTPMGRSYLRLVDAQGKLKMMIFINHACEGGVRVGDVQAVIAITSIYFRLVLGP